VTGEAALRFATKEDLRGFERSISRFFWTQNFAGAERVLLDALGDYPSLFSDICQTISQEAVSISGWDELYAQIEALARKGRHCTAIEIDLSGHADRQVQSDGTREPGFESSYYDDSTFRFSTASREEILSQCETGTMTWTGCFLDIDSALTCDGLGKLYSSLDKYQHRHWRPQAAVPGFTAIEVPQDFAAFTLGRWFLYLRVHRALWSDLYTRGLPRRMPVVVGQHDFGPPLYSVYMSETICDSSDATNRILAQRQAEARKRYDQQTEEEVGGFREWRDAIRGWPFFWNYSKRKTFIEYCALREKLLLKSGNLSVDRPTWKMSNEEFETFIERYRASRKP
jgi:hypothetical protein